MYGFHWWGMGFGWLFGLGLIIVFIWLIIRVMNHDSFYRGHRNSALDVLKERYAKGEINKEEFEEKRKDIES
jgi:putative membrane protein